jgi:hypothetical protein
VSLAPLFGFRIVLPMKTWRNWLVDVFARYSLYKASPF